MVERIGVRGSVDRGDGAQRANMIADAAIAYHSVSAVVSLEVAGCWPYIMDGRIAMPRNAAKAKPGRARAQRLETRVTAEQKNLIERAAALQGRTITDFVLTSVQDAAQRTIERHQQIELSLRDSEAFVKALLNPRPVNARLHETVRRYRAATGD